MVEMLIFFTKMVATSTKECGQTALPLPNTEDQQTEEVSQKEDRTAAKHNEQGKRHLNQGEKAAEHEGKRGQKAS